MPREGHLDAIFHLFNYLEKRHNARIVFDPCYPTIDIMTSFKECDWSSFYHSKNVIGVHFMGMCRKPSRRTLQNLVGKTLISVCSSILTTQGTNAHDGPEQVLLFS